jgi:hypothetical protein
LRLGYRFGSRGVKQSEQCYFLAAPRKLLGHLECDDAAPGRPTEKNRPSWLDRPDTLDVVRRHILNTFEAIADRHGFDQTEGLQSIERLVGSEFPRQVAKNKCIASDRVHGKERRLTTERLERGDYRRQRRTATPYISHTPGEPTNGRGFKQASEMNVHIQFLPEVHDQLYSDEGMPSQLKEVIVDTNAFYP